MGADRVGRVSRRIVFTTTPQTSLRRVAHDMLRTRCRALPVQDSSGQLCGAITLADIAARGRELPEELPVPAVA